MIYKSASSLGSWCQCAHQLRRKKINIVSTPFDWAFVPLQAILHLIETDFSHYFLRENLTPTDDRSKTVDRDSGMLIPHYFGRDEHNQVTEAIIDEDYWKLREPFLRRAERMQDLLNATGPHLYVWLTDDAWHFGRSAREASRDILNTIKRLHPAHKAHILTVQLQHRQEPDWRDAEIHNRYVPLVKKGWIGDDASWDKIMSEFTVATVGVPADELMT